MDTRSKIAALDEVAERVAANEKRVRLVTGLFDPVLAVHARRFRRLAHPDRLLVVLVRSPERPLLDERSRAELIAALADVDYVLTGEKPCDVVGALNPADIILEDEMDRRRAAAFVTRVRNRHSQ